MKPLPKLLTRMATVVVAGLFVLAGVVGWFSRDIPPPDTSDLVPERVELPADQNAFTHFLAGTKALDFPIKGDSAVRNFLADKPADEAVLRDLVARNATTFEEIRLGLECQRCIIPERDRFAFTTASQKIGKLIALKAGLEHRAGTHAAAIDACVALLQSQNSANDQSLR